MTSLLNTARPPLFCPGCSHDTIVRSLDEALQDMEIAGQDLVIVSDIGCSGLFDVFFHSHAFHGLHGRALTYGLGIKMARPDLHVIITMGDGGMGIGGAHFLSSCRRNLNMTLLVLNNFNFGMTGGQFSPTTPQDSITASGFLGGLEPPLDICRVAEAAGAPFVLRCSGLEKGLAVHLRDAIEYEGFSVVDIWGICPGRYSRKNRLTKSDINAQLESLPQYRGEVQENRREEFSRAYRKASAKLMKPPTALRVAQSCEPPQSEQCQIVIAGSAGMRCVTAGEILCCAGLSGGMLVTQKNDYDITVLRGPSVSEVIFWPGDVGYTAIEQADIVILLSEEGIKKKSDLFPHLKSNSLILHPAHIDIPPCPGEKMVVDLKSLKIKREDWALAMLAVLAGQNRTISTAMLETGLSSRLSPGQFEKAKKILTCVWNS